MSCHRRKFSLTRFSAFRLVVEMGSNMLDPYAAIIELSTPCLYSKVQQRKAHNIKANKPQNFEST
jgi:hypothetical protein